jgi:hypothetical protein
MGGLVVAVVDVVAVVVDGARRSIFLLKLRNERVRKITCQTTS